MVFKNICVLVLWTKAYYTVLKFKIFEKELSFGLQLCFSLKYFPKAVMSKGFQQTGQAFRSD